MTLRLFALVLLMMLHTNLSATPSQMETRGVWVDKRQLLQGEAFLDDLFGRLAAANFNSVNLCVLFQGYVIYPDSNYLAQHPDYRDQDYLRLAIDLAHKHGLKAYAWMEFGFYGFYSPDITVNKSMGPIFDAHPGWLSIDRQGNYFIRNREWGDFLPISPVHPDAQNFLINVHVETIQRYNFDGIDLDRIRFGNADFCFSDTARVLFLRDTGVDLRGIEKGSAEDALFTEWKKAQLNLFMQRFSRALREARPEIVITSAVASPETNNSFAQDWPTWAHYGWLDGLSPMLYTRNIGPVAQRSRDLVPADYPLLYGVDCGINTPEQVVEQIRLLRDIGAKGFVFWFAGTIDDDLELLGQTVFSEPAEDWTVRREVTRIYQAPDWREVSRGLRPTGESGPAASVEPGQSH
jgi:uncharacterized lipoprotein YddW (UPF0748 family)